eukprot:PITA_18406
MARWLIIAATATWFPSAGSFLMMVTCMLPLAAVVTASWAARLLFYRRNDEAPGTATTRISSSTDSPSHGFAGFKHKFSGRALINSSKKLFLSMKLRRREEEDGDDEMKAYDRAAMEEEGGGALLWQRSILMGERCQRPDFSGLIIYDNMGNRLPEFPPPSPPGNAVEQR